MTASGSGGLVRHNGEKPATVSVHGLAYAEGCEMIMYCDFSLERPELGSGKETIPPPVFHFFQRAHIVKVRNSWSTMRNFYIVDDLVMILTEYDKTESRTETPKLIPRYLSAAASPLFITFVTDVQPFLNYLQHSKQFDPTTSRELLWVKNNLPQSTEHLSRILGGLTTKHLGAGLRSPYACSRSPLCGLAQYLLHTAQQATAKQLLAKFHHPRSVDSTLSIGSQHLHHQ